MSDHGAGTPAPIGLGKWDGRQVGRPLVLATADTYWMFYAGSDLWGEWKIGAATSVDGIAWERLDDDPLIVPPVTRLDGGGWHSYESPWASLTPDGFRLLACATGGKPLSAIVSFRSSDGVTWSEPLAELVASPLDEGILQFRDPWIVDEDGRESLFITRVLTTANDRESALVRYIRAQGSEWTESGSAIADPDGGLVSLAAVLRTERGWTLWCSSFVDGRYRILVAYSPDLDTWSVPREIIAGDPASPYETQGVFGPMVVRGEDGGYLMWHLTSSRTSDGFSVAVRLRRSDDGETWTVVTERPVFTARPGVPVRPW